MFAMSAHSKQMFQMLALVLCVFAFVGMIMISSTTVAFCAEPDVAGTINNAFSQITMQIFNIIKAVIVPCCIVALGFAGFQFLVGGNQGAEKARKVVIAVACAIGFVLFAPLVVQAVTKILASGSGTHTDSKSDWDKFNPLLPTA